LRGRIFCGKPEVHFSGKCSGQAERLLRGRETVGIADFFPLQPAAALPTLTVWAGRLPGMTKSGDLPGRD
jgi:hypothetical protein